MKYVELLSKRLSEIESDPLYCTFLPVAKRQSDEEFFHFNKQKGVTFTFDTESSRLKQLDFFSDGYQGYRQFAGELPKKLRFDMGKEEVNKMLGEPSQHSIAKKLPILGQIPAGDSYDFSTYKLIIRYTETLSDILLVTLCVK